MILSNRRLSQGGVVERRDAPARGPGAVHRPGSEIAAPPRPHRLYDQSKRLIDMAVAALLLLATLPLLLLACCAIALTTGENPVLRQTRIGRQGRAFGMLKLRTMRAGATDNCRDSAAHPVIDPKLYHDGRVTGVGHWLRRTSIDELPQLLNVLAGDMSLVGPRPGLPREVARYPHSWTRRLAVKPGLTGLWQVSGRSTVGPQRWMAMDRYYVGHRSLWLDCAILLRSVPAVVSMRGAW